VDIVTFQTIIVSIWYTTSRQLYFCIEITRSFVARLNYSYFFHT